MYGANLPRLAYVLSKRPMSCSRATMGSGSAADLAAAANKSACTRPALDDAARSERDNPRSNVSRRSIPPLCLV